MPDSSVDVCHDAIAKVDGCVFT